MRREGGGGGGEGNRSKVGGGEGIEEKEKMEWGEREVRKQIIEEESREGWESPRELYSGMPHVQLAIQATGHSITVVTMQCCKRGH